VTLKQDWMIEEIQRADGGVDKRVQQQGKAVKETTMARVFQTDAWRAIHKCKGNATTHSVFMRDIISFYKTGRFVHATRAWLDGEELQVDSSVDTPELPQLSLLDIQTDGCGELEVVVRSKRIGRRKPICVLQVCSSYS
jgi:hypothetical protein